MIPTWSGVIPRQSSMIPTWSGVIPRQSMIPTYGVVWSQDRAARSHAVYGWCDPRQSSMIDQLEILFLLHAHCLDKDWGNNKEPYPAIDSISSYINLPAVPQQVVVTYPGSALWDSGSQCQKQNNMRTNSSKHSPCKHWWYYSFSVCRSKKWWHIDPCKLTEVK